jgi:hypothetical protein
MSPKDFENKMKELKTPRTEGVKPPEGMKLAIVNAQRSATAGASFVPCLFYFLPQWC